MQLLNLFNEDELKLSQYADDTKFKALFSVAEPCAMALSCVTEEFRGMSVEEILPYIHNMKNPSDPSSPIDLLNKEIIAWEGGRVYLDVFFKVSLPNKGERFYQIAYIDLEMQRNYNPGYVMARRCIYYASQKIGRQVTSLAETKNYDLVEKVHSIWVFLHGYPASLTNRAETFSITRHRDTNEELFDDLVKLEKQFDIMDITCVFVGKTVKPSDPLAVKFFNECLYHEQKFNSRFNINTVREVETVEKSYTQAIVDETMKRADEEKKRAVKRAEIRTGLVSKFSFIRRGLSEGLSEDMIVKICGLSSPEYESLTIFIAKYPFDSNETLADRYLTYASGANS